MPPVSMNCFIVLSLASGVCFQATLNNIEPSNYAANVDKARNFYFQLNHFYRISPFTPLRAFCSLI